MASKEGKETWSTMESDPAVFTELIQRLGVKNVAVEEMVALDASFLEPYENIYGLILLFKWQQKELPNYTVHVTQDAPVYFCQQVVENSCATVAVINTLCNNKDRLDLGDYLNGFWANTMDFTPDLRGLALGTSEEIKKAHESFTAANFFEIPDRPDAPTGDAFHYVTFVHAHGAIWELDGLREGPVHCGDATPENYKKEMMSMVERRIASLSASNNNQSEGDITFALMAVVDDPIALLEKQIEELKAAEKPIDLLTAQLMERKEIRAADEEANRRRRHNYTPFIMALLQALAEKGKLEDAIQTTAAKK